MTSCPYISLVSSPALLVVQRVAFYGFLQKRFGAGIVFSVLYDDDSMT